MAVGTKQIEGIVFAQYPQQTCSKRRYYEGINTPAYWTELLERSAYTPCLLAVLFHALQAPFVYFPKSILAHDAAYL